PKGASPGRIADRVRDGSSVARVGRSIERQADRSGGTVECKAGRQLRSRYPHRRLDDNRQPHYRRSRRKVSATLVQLDDPDQVAMDVAVNGTDLVLTLNRPQAPITVHLQHRGQQLSGKW